MVMQKYLYSKCPSDGAGNHLNLSEILKDVQDYKISLMQIFWINSFQHVHAYQIPVVHDWLLSHLSPFMLSDSTSQIPFSSYNAQEKKWYIYRQEKDTLFGPLAIAEILKMKKKDFIYNDDFCFSFNEESYFYAKELPEIQISPKEKDQPFYFQRRSRRFNQLHQCKTKIHSKGQTIDVELIDFSENGAAIISQFELLFDEQVEISITLIDHNIPNKTFNHNAIIRSARNENGKTRYGLFLLDKAHLTLENLKNEKKAA